jgi:flavin-dependent thymidylate synthase
VTDSSGEIVRYADKAMFDAEPMERDASGRVAPKVYLLNMTPDPLGAIAAACFMYEGRVIRDLSEITDEERLDKFQQVQKTHLQAPFEFVDFHFMIEGVTRSFTHQMVRQRTAVYAQESLRFAVKDGIDEEVALPPSLAGADDDDPRRVLWQQAVNRIDDIYSALIDNGMPAEDARGLLPHNITTRLHYKTNLRGLLEHGGNRLCTQAQFEWRLVWMQIVQAIREYDGAGVMVPDIGFGGEVHDVLDARWQQDTLANLFRPICYLTGKCEFKASFDRACSIRNRVDANHEAGRGSESWGTEYDVVEGNPIVVGVGPQSVVRDEQNKPVFIGAISPAEWLLDPAAARVRA